MEILARIRSNKEGVKTTVQTNDKTNQLVLAQKANGQGSSTNGGELLLLAIATCFCNDLYREAAKRNIKLEQVEVIATGNFGNEGEPGFNFQYETNILADVSEQEIQSLIMHTDKVAEVHNTLRKGISVSIR